MSPGLTDNTGRGKRIPRSALLTASLGKGAKGTGDADCHSQCAHLLRNDRFCKGCGGTGGVEPRPYGGQEDLGKPGVGRAEAFAPTELYHGVRRRGFCPARGRPQGSALRKEKRCGRAGRCSHRPLRKHYKGCNGRATARVAPTGALQGVCRGERNPPVTASPCQPPLGKGAYKDGGYGLPRPVCALASQ